MFLILCYNTNEEITQFAGGGILMKIFDRISSGIEHLKGLPPKKPLEETGQIADKQEVYEKAQDGLALYQESHHHQIENRSKLLKPYVKFIKDNTNDPRISLAAKTALQVDTSPDDGISVRAQVLTMQAAMAGLQSPASVLLAKIALQTMIPYRDEAFNSIGHGNGNGSQKKNSLSTGDRVSYYSERAESVGKTYLKAIADNSGDPGKAAEAKYALKQKYTYHTMNSDNYFSALQRIADYDASFNSGVSGSIARTFIGT